MKKYRICEKSVDCWQRPCQSLSAFSAVKYISSIKYENKRLPMAMMQSRDVETYKMKQNDVFQ